MKAEQAKTFPIRCNRGFTMIEVIAILILIGILAVVMISKSTSTDIYSVASEAEILKNHIRFAQIKAMGDLDPHTWGIILSSTSYTLRYDTTNSTFLLPGESSATHTFKGVSASPSQTIAFDSWGSPGTTDCPTITLTGGTGTAAIIVKANTGFIQ